MKTIMKRLAIVTFVFIFAIVASVPCGAAVLGSLNYWYSDASSIGKWYSNTIVVKTAKLNSDSNFPFDTAVSHAASQWSSPLGITISPSASATWGNIEYYGGTRAEILAYTGYTIPSNETGRTVYYYRYNDGTWIYGSTSKTGYVHDFIYCYLVSDNRTTAAYKNTATHEMGHGLGWYGHSSNINDIMYSIASTVTTLTNRDKYHLSQIY